MTTNSGNAAGGVRMAIAVTSPAVGRLAAALGLERCRKATISLGVDEVVMVRAEQYAEVDQLTRMSVELETNDYVVVTRHEYEVLKSEARMTARERKEAVAFWQGELRSRTAERDASRARVAELEAASGGVEGEPVAWRVEYRGFIEIYSVEQFATERASEVRGTVVPLYRSPPPPRGWLTGEEREAVESGRIHISNADGLDEATERECKWVSEVCCRLLTRSTPPEVVMPVCPFTHDSTHAMGWWEAAGKIKRLLAAAGVKCKEV